MGQLYETKVRIDQIIQERNLDQANIRGKIGMQAGFLLSMLSPQTPDDPDKLVRLRKAAEAVLNARL
jgi:hypothetical protein